MKKRPVLIYLPLFFVFVIFCYLFITKPHFQKFPKTTGPTLQNEQQTNYEIKESEVKGVLSELGFTEKNLVINKVSVPPSDQAVTITDDSGKIILASYIQTDNKDTLNWSLFVDPDFLKKSSDTLSKDRVKELKQLAMSNVSLNSFIIYSKDPQRKIDILYPVETRPILFRIN